MLELNRFKTQIAHNCNIFKIIFSFILFFCTFSIKGQSQTLKKIYLEALYESNGVTPDIKNRVRNQISLNLYKHFKKTHSFIDDVIINGYLNQLKKQQQIGCDTEKCYKMIEDSLSPDQKLSGSLQFSNGKYTLTLRLIDLSSQKGLVDVKEVTYTQNQMEYFVEEITRALLEPNYKINTANAPPEFKEEKIDFGSIRIKSIDGIDINIYEFRSNDTRGDLIIASLKPKLEEGDKAFKDKKYLLASTTYQSIIEGIQESLTLETRRLIKVYEEGIISRRNQSFYNVFQNEITKIDSEFSTRSKDTPEVLKEYTKKYEKILNSLNRLSPDKQKEISAALNKRIETLVIKLLEIQEKKADKQYDNFFFTEAFREYKDIFSSLQSRDGEGYNSYRIKIEKKVRATETTGKSFVAGRVKSYCDLAEREYLEYSLKKKEFSIFARFQAENKIEEYLENAENILKKSDFATQEVIDSYNRLVSLINENKDRESRVGRFFHKDDAFSTDSMNQIRMDKSLYFPGNGHIYVEPGELKSKFLYYGGWASFWYVLYAGNKTYITYNQYSSFERTPTFYYLYLNSTGGNLIALNDTFKINQLHSDYQRTAIEFNNSLGIFSVFYMVSLIDAFTYSDEKNIIGKNDLNSIKLIDFGNDEKLEIKANASLYPGNFLARPTPEVQYILEYSNRF